MIVIVANITAQQAMRNVGDSSLMELKINVAFWHYAIQQSMPEILQENLALITDIESEWCASPATHWDMKLGFRTVGDEALIWNCEGHEWLFVH